MQLKPKSTPPTRESGDRMAISPKAILSTAALVVIIGIFFAIYSNNAMSGIKTDTPKELTVNGITIEGLYSQVVIPDDLSIYTLGSLKADTAYLQYWPKGKFGETDAMNVYIIAKKEDLRSGLIKISSAEYSVDGLKLMDAWGSKDDLYANVFVDKDHFVNIRTNVISGPTANINVRESQSKDFTLSTSKKEAFLFGDNTGEYYFITITSIDRVA